MNDRQILFFQWDSLMNPPLEKAFQKLGIPYRVYYEPLNYWEINAELSQRLRDTLKKGLYHAVLSVNYVPIISNVCMELGLPYISWIYDSPINIRDLSSLSNSCNQIYCFDREQALEYQKAGINARHLPLAVDPELMKKAIRSQAYPKMQVSMVGQLYHTEYSYFISPLPPYHRGYIEAAVQSQIKLYGAYILDKMVTPDFLESMNRQYARLAKDGFQMGERELGFLLAQEVTNRERLSILGVMSRFFQVHLFADRTDEILKRVEFHGRVEYQSEMPNVFANTDINLNISLKSIKSGIPLRALDIMGCGGFLLSNYQLELGEYFQLGEECESYEGIQEAVEKAHFYLNNEGIRKRVAMRGLEKVKKHFTFEERLRTMVDGI